MTEYPQVLTHKLTETDYFKQQLEEEKQKITDWLLVNGFINAPEGHYPAEDTSPIEITVFQSTHQ